MVLGIQWALVSKLLLATIGQWLLRVHNTGHERMTSIRYAVKVGVRERSLNRVQRFYVRKKRERGRLKCTRQRLDDGLQIGKSNFYLILVHTVVIRVRVEPQAMGFSRFRT